MLTAEGLIRGVKGTGIFVNGELPKDINLTHRLVMVVMPLSGHYYGDFYEGLREELLKPMTQEFGINTYFEGICGSDNIYAAGKIERGLRMLADYGIAPSETLMIGDTLHDAEVANRLGFACILYAGGHNDEQRLRRKAPVIHSFGELL